ncbi:unnamed protein product [Rangifer tarandus platyrhynchus]|uniref:Uncharacterized protein n=2 Tax=Rangifer tarandus platyrhynchus TaxID=3082113 RepID=A0AC59ZIU2_RANTA|nr:unnamed protein product [Rangifer tarandus platyrhynchus]
MLTGAEGAHRTGSTSQLSPGGQWPCCSPPLLCPSLPTACHHTDSRKQMPTNSPGASCAPTSFLSPPPSLPHPHRPPPHCSCNSQVLVLPQGICMGCAVCLDHHPGFPYGLVPPVTLMSLKSPLMSTGGRGLFLLQWTAGPRVSAWQLCLYAQQGTWHVVGKYWLTPQLDETDLQQQDKRAPGDKATGRGRGWKPGGVLRAMHTPHLPCGSGSVRVTCVHMCAPLTT